MSKPLIAAAVLLAAGLGVVWFLNRGGQPQPLRPPVEIDPLLVAFRPDGANSLRVIDLTTDQPATGLEEDISTAPPPGVSRRPLRVARWSGGNRVNSSAFQYDGPVDLLDSGRPGVGATSDGQEGVRHTLFQPRPDFLVRVTEEDKGPVAGGPVAELAARRPDFPALPPEARELFDDLSGYPEVRIILKPTWNRELEPDPVLRALGTWRGPHRTFELAAVTVYASPADAREARRRGEKHAQGDHWKRTFRDQRSHHWSVGSRCFHLSQFGLKDFAR